MEFDPRSLVGLAGAPVVLALVQLVKSTFPALESRFLPAIVLGMALVLNVALALLLGIQGAPGLGAAALVGVVTGLAASGLYSWSTSGGQPQGAAPTTGPGPVGPKGA